ncbi:glucosamine-6-phosphate isomerase [Vallitalea longa]|uniref:Glucosamine-6-phosphate isomerase n=1 Tax=Vallitalea longa TaxID=2936439 RepID=A0A9W5YG95_9FIRM|nr:glucosamine-6-phosphate isomerase [Vallitalea longa]GKX32261.1 glucosamine-6-phosphate isomerase [Vallitalea longa]
MKDYYKIGEEKLGENSKIPLEIMDTEDDVYHDMAWTMFDTIKYNNEKGKKTVFICPVGPVGQYKRFARLVNKYRLDLSNVYIFNMDEYLNANMTMIDTDNPLSFKGFMYRELYGKIDEELNIPEDHRFFPEPSKENEIHEKMTELGGVDICFGGVGINGHIAFNEPPEESENVIDQEFRNIGTRILKISRETRTINAAGALGGAISVLPKWCITLGMKEILSSRKIRLYMFRDWHRAVVRRAIYGEITAKFPVTFLQEHNDAKIIISKYVAQKPF